jgi:D-inositol-3-phosphate glycosyltransferase
MKILFVLENYLPHIGGVEVLFKQICESLARKHHVTIITHRIPGTKIRENIGGVDIVRVPVPTFLSRYFFTFLALPYVWKHSKDADILHTTTYTAAPSTSFVSFLRNKPSVITIHEVIGKSWMDLEEMGYLSRMLHRALEWLVISLRFNKYVCVSNSTKKDFELVKKSKSGTVIHNGVDYDFWASGKYDKKKVRDKLKLKDNFIYFFYGRPGVSKGFEYLLKAVPIIKKKIPDSKLVAILSTDKTYQKQYKELMKLIETLCVKDDVIIIEPVKRAELPDYILASDCVVVPSLTEGFGFAVAESCALGKIVVASDAKSIPEVISGKYVLVEPKSPLSIAKGVISAWNGKVKRTPLKKFYWSKTISAYERLYMAILSKGNKVK